MPTFIVLARFLPDTDMAQVREIVPEERAQVAALKAAGRLGAVHIALSRGAVFLEIFAADAAGAEATARTLPLSRWWSLDVYPIVAPLP